jgi:L-ribulose-5-phosphate 3-epimerase UlaE
MNGEGIQIGEGDVVLKDLIEHLDKNSICAQFVPEIWQGHTKVLAEVFGKLRPFYKK